MSSDGTISQRDKLTMQEAIALICISIGGLSIIFGASVLWGWEAAVMMFGLVMLALGFFLGFTTPAE